MANEGEDAGPLTKPMGESVLSLTILVASTSLCKMVLEVTRRSPFTTGFGLTRMYLQPFKSFSQSSTALLRSKLQMVVRPNIIDVKMGARTWYLEAGPKYVEKCKLKYKETTSEALGFRISGMQVYEAKKGEVWKASRAWCKYMKPEDVPEALKRFVSSNPSAEKGYDGAFAKAVYGAALTELQRLEAWLEVQTTYHFFSASVLLIYEGEPRIPRAVSVRLVDFAHVLYDRDTIDENQFSGLNALMKMLTEIVDSGTKVAT